MAYFFDHSLTLLADTLLKEKAPEPACKGLSITKGRKRQRRYSGKE